jgi:hypothetical protein
MGRISPLDLRHRRQQLAVERHDHLEVVLSGPGREPGVEDLRRERGRREHGVGLGERRHAPHLVLSGIRQLVSAASGRS